MTMPTSLWGPFILIIDFFEYWLDRFELDPLDPEIFDVPSIEDLFVLTLSSFLLDSVEAPN